MTLTTCRECAAAFAIAATLAGASFGCGGSSTAATAAPTVSTVSVTGSAPVVGATAQFSATATLSNGTTQTATSQAAWSSSNTGVAVVSSAGVVTGVSVGEADITATFQAVSGRSHVAIANAAASTFILSGTVTDGTSGGVLPNVTIQVIDSAGNTKTAASGASGVFSIGGLAAGPATLTATAVSYQITRMTVAVSGDTRADVVMLRVSCTLTVTPASFAFASTGGTGTVTVSSQATGCAWQARSNDAFITVTSANGGIDSGTVSFSVAANTGAGRAGSLLVAGTVVTVTQAAALVMVTAVYDPIFKTPVCNGVGIGCDPGTLLDGSGSTEAHQPNTLFDSCADGVGAGHFGLIRFVRVATIDGAEMSVGRTVRIDVSDAASTAGSARVYLAADALHPVWTQVGTSPVPPGSGAFTIQTVLPAGTMQAIRVTRSFIGSYGPGPCATGPDDDNDDLVFRVTP